MRKIFTLAYILICSSMIGCDLFGATNETTEPYITNTLATISINPNVTYSLEESVNWFVVENTEYQYGVVNQENEVVIPFIFDRIDYIYDGTFIVKILNDYGVINYLGDYVIPLGYDYIERIALGNYFYVVDDEHNRMVMDGLGDVVLSLDFVDKYYHYENERLIFESAGKMGVVDLEGNIILEPEYDRISIKNEKDIYIITKNDLSGLVDFNGNVVLPIIYDEIEYQRDGLYATSIGDTRSLFDDKGDLIYEVISEIPIEINEFGVSAIKRSYHYGLIDLTGEQIIGAKYQFSGFPNGNSVFENVMFDTMEMTGAILDPEGFVRFTSDEWIIKDFNDETVVVVKPSDYNTYWVIDYEGNILLGPSNKIYTYWQSENELIFHEQVDSSNSLIGYNIYEADGKTLLLELVSNGLIQIDYNRRIVMSYEERPQVISFDGEVILDLQGVRDFIFSENCIHVYYENETVALYDFDGNVIIDSDYIRIISYHLW